MVVLPEEVLVVGDPPPMREEVEAVTLVEAGESGSPEIRQPSRKMALHSLASLGHLAKSRPKSPLIRMAEMRKSGLRGTALRQSGKKGSDVLEVRDSKGKKALKGRGSRVLESIPENNEEGVGVLEDLREEGCAVGFPSGEVVVMLQDQNVGSYVPRLHKQDWQKEALLAGALNDCALDLIAAQPLQEMNFVAQRVLLTGSVGDSGGDCLMVELNLVEGKGGEKPYPKLI